MKEVKISYYKITISETGRNSLKETGTIFNRIEEICYTKDEVKQFFIDKYGKIPKGKTKVYIDAVNKESVEIGFTHSFWNKDISHNSKSWYQTDWIDITSILERPVLLKSIL